MIGLPGPILLSGKRTFRACISVLDSLGASMTQTGTRRPSGMKMVLGTISSGLDANSFGSCHSVTNTRMLGQEYGLTSELSSRRTDVPWIFFLSFGQLSP